MTLPRGVKVLAVLAAGALFGAAVPALARGGAAPVGWWMVRSTGLVAYFALWATLLSGVWVSSRGAGGWLSPPVAIALHRQWSLVTVFAAAAHGLAIVADPWGVSRWALVVPFASGRLTGAVALGTLAAWGIAAVVTSSEVQPFLPRGLWRAVHGTAFGTFVLALVHGVAAGTDTALVFRALYAATAAVLLGATLQRIAWAAHDRPNLSTNSGPHVPKSG